MTSAEKIGLKVGDRVRVINHPEFAEDVWTILYCGYDTVDLKRNMDNALFSFYISDIEKIGVSDENNDSVNNPNHYQILPGIEVYDIREAILSKHPDLHPCIVDDWSRSWEYLTRMFGKNGLEDAKKASWYLNKLIDRMENTK